MNYPERTMIELLDGHVGSLDTGGRTEAREKAVSPCSEYTRYTVEGVFKDPYSNLSVILDIHSLGFLFSGSGLKDPKWSKVLGYGMGMIGAETRVHIHKNGKFVIRRAMDQDDAERCSKGIASILWPTVFSTRTDRFNWSIMREAAWHDLKNKDLEGPMITWPFSNVGDPEEIVAGMMEKFRELDGEHLEDLRNRITNGLFAEGKELEDILEVASGMRRSNAMDLRKIMVNEEPGTDISKAIGTFHLWIDIGLSHLEKLAGELVKEGKDLSHVMEIANGFWSESWSGWKELCKFVDGGKMINIVGVHFLLGPVCCPDKHTRDRNQQ